MFVLVNSQVVYAAGSSGASGDLLAPLDITSSEGVPINGYELNASGGSIVAFKSQALAFALAGLFTLIRLLVGLAGWAIELAFRFPLLKILARPAQEVADAYDDVVVDALGLKGLLLAWAFVFAGFMIVRGRVGRGLGEIFLTLLIGALAASVFVRPDYLLAQDGPLGQGQQVAAEVAQRSVNAYNWGGKLAGRGPCDGLAGRQEAKCLEREGQGPVSAAEVARPLQDSITNALIVKPYMLLQYGRILDPAKGGDRKAYAVHLKWVTGGYRAKDGPADASDPCEKVIGPGKAYCERDTDDDGTADALPELTPGGELLDASQAIVTDEDREFSAFLQDLEKAGAVGRACADYARAPTWWRLGGAALLLIAAGFICGMLLSSTLVMLGTQAVCVGAAAVGGVTFVAAMLPGPPRQSVWKWLSLWGISVLALVAVCAFVPFFGIAVDATITEGPDLMVERILLIDVLAVAGAAGHRRLLTGITSFGRRTAMRMRYAKVGGTHLPGDTSELGAALALNSPAALGGFGGGLRGITGGAGGRFGLLGTRQRLTGALASLADGAGMPVDTGRVLADAGAEAGRGLAPLTAAAAVGGLGARLGGKGALWLLIGRRPEPEQLTAWRKPTAGGDAQAGGPAGSPGSGPGSGGGGGGPRRPGGPPDRYRTEDGQVVDRRSGHILHDQNSDRTLLSTRAHNRLVRFRGYRILHRTGRTAYGATAAISATADRARRGGSQFSYDARQQVRVWGNTIREDGQAWADTRLGQQVARTLPARSHPRATPPNPATSPPPAAPSAASLAARAGRVAGRTPPSVRPGSPPSARAGGTGTSVSPGGPAGQSRARPDPSRASALPGSRRTRNSTRDEARRRMQELMRRTAPEAESEPGAPDRSRPPSEDGDPE
ncbi:hypothetical protein [Streptomyces fructofermentans]|uniref:hypothetical protein n=1 Tax=Streptomyces fructofermentans TaxID=152141 RepID=UPI0027E50806|nr:hypothetical protein [Streptomyces fructofermentans]